MIGLTSTGGMIASAGLAMAATFLVLGTLPLVILFLAEIGVVVTLGVILDTFVVRSVLVTALNLDLGGKIWRPQQAGPGRMAVARRPAGDPRRPGPSGPAGRPRPR